jgi:hypothetical protein
MIYFAKLLDYNKREVDYDGLVVKCQSTVSLSSSQHGKTVVVAYTENRLETSVIIGVVN